MSSTMAKTCLTLILATSLALSGCATMSDRQQTVGGGAAVGAGLGAVLGYVVGDGRGALIGAAIGGAAGALAGHVVAERKAQYASREDFLDAEAKRVAEYNATARDYNEQLRKDIARLSEEAETLRADYGRQEAQQVQLAQKRSELQDRLQRSAALEQELAKELDVQKVVLEQERQEAPKDDPYIAELEKEVLALQANLESLREGSVQLAGIDERLSI